MLVLLIYYGTFLPNTAYAKLNTGISLSFYLKHGLSYYSNSLRLDPVTLSVIFGAIIVSFRSKRVPMVAAAVGIVLYLLYILRIGGGYMSGRHFSGPFLGAVMLWCVNPPVFTPTLRKNALIVVGAALALLAMVHPLSPVRSGSNFGRNHPELQDSALNDGIQDERGYHHLYCGLLNAPKYDRMPGIPWRTEGEQCRKENRPLVIIDHIGIFGFFAGPDTHIVDPYALPDPFLARMPISQGVPSQMGHMRREISREYIDTLTSGKIQFTDPETVRLYEALQRVHSGPIWSWQRWKDIWRLYIVNADDS